MKKVTLYLMIFTLVSKLLGFLRDIVLSYYFGASGVSDAYLISQTIPNVIFAFVSAGIVVGFIPMISKIENIESNNAVNKFTNNLVNIVILISTLIIILVFIFAEHVVKAFAIGFEGETLNHAIILTRISIFGILFYGIRTIFKGYLEYKNQFLITGLIGVPFNLILLLSLYFASKFNIFVLGIGSIIASLSQLVFLLPSIMKSGYKHHINFNIKNKYIMEMLTLSIPIILSVSVNEINVLVDRTIASSIASGGISALTYANRLNQFIQGIFVLAIVTVLYPTISKCISRGEYLRFQKNFKEAINGMNILIIPMTIGALIFSEQIIGMLFFRGSFDQQALKMSSDALFYYSIGMIGFGLRELLSRVFYAMQDTKTPMFNASIGMLLNIILNIILSKFMGLGGLALATSISAVFTTGLLFVSLHKKIGPFGMKQISVSFMKILVASFIMGVSAKLGFNYLIKSLSQNISLILAIGIGALLYFIIIYFMKIEDVDLIVGIIKKKFERKRDNI